MSMKKPSFKAYSTSSKAKRVYWKLVAGPKLDDCQMSDLVYDDYDKKIRGL
jgi:hypothetical protein